jgi:hypothetical protein
MGLDAESAGAGAEKGRSFWSDRRTRLTPI